MVIIITIIITKEVRKVMKTLVKTIEEIKEKKNETCGKQQEYFCEEIFIFLTNKTMFHNKNRKNRREKLLDPQETIDSIELCLD